jgi:pimeloyl-ACP methyl ester carboxylesterase
MSYFWARVKELTYNINMLTLILPGYSPTNKAWLLETKEKLKPLNNVVAYEWQHWTTGKELDIKAETEKILTIIGTQKVNIIAKSIGTKVLMSMLPKIPEQVNKVILCGIPMDPLAYLKGIKQINSKDLIIFQNSKDPLMPYFLIEKYIHLIDKNIKVVEKDADNHDYFYFEDFLGFLNQQ